MEFKVSDIKIFPSKIEGKIKAFASIEISGVLKIFNIRIIDGSKGLFVGWPSRKTDKGYSDIVVFDGKIRDKVCDRILEKYNEANPAPVEKETQPESNEDDFDLF